MLVQALVISHIDYCNAFPTGVTTCVVKQVQMVQNVAARLVFNQPKRAHVTPLLIELHWLSLAARIRFKSLMLAYRVLSGKAPLYLNNLVKAHATSRPLRSAYEHHLANPAVQSHQSTVFS